MMGSLVFHQNASRIRTYTIGQLVWQPSAELASLDPDIVIVQIEIIFVRYKAKVYWCYRLTLEKCVGLLTTTHNN